MRSGLTCHFPKTPPRFQPFCSGLRAAFKSVCALTLHPHHNPIRELRRNRRTTSPTLNNNIADVAQPLRRCCPGPPADPESHHLLPHFLSGGNAVPIGAFQIIPARARLYPRSPEITPKINTPPQSSAPELQKGTAHLRPSKPLYHRSPTAKLTESAHDVANIPAGDFASIRKSSQKITRVFSRPHTRASAFFGIVFSIIFNIFWQCYPRF